MGSETDLYSFGISSSFNNYVSSTNVDFSEFNDNNSFKTNSELFPKAPLTSNSSNLYYNDYPSTNDLSDYTSNKTHKTKQNVSELLAVCGPSLDTIFTKNTTPRGVDDVLEVFQEISASINDDEQSVISMDDTNLCDDNEHKKHSKHNKKHKKCRKNSMLRARSHAQTKRTKHKAKKLSFNGSDLGNKPKFKYSMTENRNHYHYEQGYNYEKYTKRRRKSQNPFNKHVLSK